MLDPEVNRLKFDGEVSRLKQQAALLEKRGCFLLSATYPNLDVLVLPDRSLALQFLTDSPSIIVRSGPRLQEQLIPSVTGRSFVCRFGLDDFDLRPPSVIFLTATTREPLGPSELPRGHLMTAGRPEAVILDEHPVLRRSFLCVRGTREYHEHPQHSGDDWFLYRGSIGVLHLLDVLWRTMKMGIPVVKLLPGRIDFSWGYPNKER